MKMSVKGAAQCRMQIEFLSRTHSLSMRTPRGRMVGKLQKGKDANKEKITQRFEAARLGAREGVFYIDGIDPGRKGMRSTSFTNFHPHSIGFLFLSSELFSFHLSPTQTS